MCESWSQLCNRALEAGCLNGCVLWTTAHILQFSADVGCATQERQARYSPPSRASSNLSFWSRKYPISGASSTACSMSSMASAVRP